MKLYHGTSSKIAKKALKTGLLPRSITGTSQWEHTIDSNPDCVYLTDAYPLYFSVNAANTKNSQPAIIEIDTDKLDQSKLYPDEDVLEQAGRKADDLPKDWDMNKRTEHYRTLLPMYNRGEWKKSLEAMGTCAYGGTIPPEAITRIVIIDHKKQAGLCWTAMDASISLLNYNFMKGKYRALTNWIFQNPIDYSSDAQYGDLSHFDENIRKAFTIKGLIETFDENGRDGIVIKNVATQ